MPAFPATVFRWSALSLLMVAAAVGCGTRESAQAAVDGSTPANAYQRIPPPLVSTVSVPPAGPEHWTADQMPRPEACRLIDCRSPYQRNTAFVATARPFDLQAWLTSPQGFRLPCVTQQVPDWLSTPNQPIGILADTDFDAAIAWTMLRCARFDSLHVIYHGAETLRAAQWPVLDSRPGDYVPPDLGAAPTTAVLPPDWLMSADDFSRLTAGLTPVSTPPKPAEPAAPDVGHDIEDLFGPPAPGPSPDAPAAAGPEPADGFIYCGSLADWQATANEDQLVRGMVRVPPLEMFQEGSGALVALEERQRRLAQLQLDPQKRYILTGPRPADVAAVFMALSATGYSHLRIYLP